MVLPALGGSGIQGTSVFMTVQGGKQGEYFALTPLADMSDLEHLAR